MCISRGKKTVLKSPYPKSTLVRVIEKLKASQFVITQSKGRSFFVRSSMTRHSLFIFIRITSLLALFVLPLSTLVCCDLPSLHYNVLEVKAILSQLLSHA